MTQDQPETPSFLPLGSVVILKGAVKKLLVVSRGSVVEGEFFDYGAFLYPEGMIDSNIAYFNRGDIVKVVFQGYADADDDLALEILNDAHAEFLRDAGGERVAAESVDPVVIDDDPFAGVRDLGDDDE